MTQQLPLAGLPYQGAIANPLVIDQRNLVVEGPNVQAMLNAVAADLEIVPQLDIDSDDLASDMQTMLGRLATADAALEADRKKRKAPVIEIERWLDDGYRPAATAVRTVIDAGKAKLLAWAAVKRERARKAAEEAEAARRAEAARKAAEEAAAIAAASAAAAEAQRLREAGSEQVAQAMEQQAQVAVDTARQNAAQAVQALHVGPLTAPAAKTKGASQTWKGEFTDLSALIVAVGKQIEAGDRSNLALLMGDQKALDAVAKVQKEHLSVPGVRPYCVERQAIRKVAVDA
jgi:hypothetical protein